jgi:hypothetical protein
MKRRDFTKGVAASASLLMAPFRATAANRSLLDPAGEKPPTGQHPLTPPTDGTPELIPEPPASGAAWGEHLATLTPARRLGFVIGQLVLCKPVCPHGIIPLIDQLNWEQTQYGWPRQATLEQLSHPVRERPRPGTYDWLPWSHLRRALAAFLAADRAQAPLLGEALYSAIHAVACSNYYYTTKGRFPTGTSGPVRYIAKANAEAFARFTA